MKRWKKYTSPLVALTLCAVLTACGGDNSNDDNLDNSVVGDDWRASGVVCDSGTITRDGKDTAVLVCAHSSNATFYYDKKEQVKFGSVEYPLTLESDAGEAFQSIDFADLNKDGNSDVTMKFNDGGSELLMVWFWNTESNQFAYQPDESQLGEKDEGRGDVIPDDDEKDDGRGDVIPHDGKKDDGRGDVIPDDSEEDDGRGDVIPDDSEEDDGRGDVIPDDGEEDDGRGDVIPDESEEDDGRGDLITAS